MKRTPDRVTDLPAPPAAPQNRAPGGGRASLRYRAKPARNGYGVTAVLAAGLLLIAARGDLHAGGGVVLTGEGCTMHIDFYSARFTAYQPETRGNREFCEDLPDTGPTLFVLDYLHPSLKLVPVDFRIIRNVTGQGRHAKWEDVASLGDLEAHTLYYHPPVVRPDASFQVEYDFADEGEYIGIVTAGHPTNDQTYRSVFPFEVGRNRRWAPLLGLTLLAAAATALWRRRRSESPAAGA